MGPSCLWARQFPMFHQKYEYCLNNILKINRIQRRRAAWEEEEWDVGDVRADSELHCRGNIPCSKYCPVSGVHAASCERMEPDGTFKGILYGPVTWANILIDNTVIVSISISELFNNFFLGLSYW